MVSLTEIADSSGNYSVTLVSSNSCTTDTLVQNISISIPTGLSQFSQPNNKLICYPNPAKNTVLIDCQETIEVIKLLNFAGIEVKCIEKINNKKNILNLQMNARGIYYLIVKTQNGQIITNKLILI